MCAGNGLNRHALRGDLENPLPPTSDRLLPLGLPQRARPDPEAKVLRASLDMATCQGKRAPADLSRNSASHAIARPSSDGTTTPLLSGSATPLADFISPNTSAKPPMPVAGRKTATVSSAQVCTSPSPVGTTWSSAATRMPITKTKSEPFKGLPCTTPNVTCENNRMPPSCAMCNASMR